MESDCRSVCPARDWESGRKAIPQLAEVGRKLSKKTDLNVNGVAWRGSWKASSLEKRLSQSFRILGRQSWVGLLLVLNLFELQGICSNWCKMRQRHNLTNTGKRFTDPPPKPGTPCEKPFIFFNVFLSQMMKLRPGKVRALGGFFCFVLFFRRSSMCGWDTSQVRAAPGIGSQFASDPAQSPFS